ncbi:MAG: hypothetical protein M1608_14300 [Candidatus Omnitrophica bacterium]|nr:hypothetical protein [Candidatus Omnitrophota bacterium]
MNTVVIYENYELAANAVSILKRVAQHADPAVELNLKPWRLDVLTTPPMTNAALAEAIDAELIILAMQESEPLPAWLMDWMELWAGHRQVQNAAVALLCGKEGKTLAAADAKDLQQFTDRHGLSYLSSQGETAKNESTDPGQVEMQHDSSPTSTSDDTPKRPNYNQHWGINE